MPSLEQATVQLHNNLVSKARQDREAGAAGVLFSSLQNFVKSEIDEDRFNPYVIRGAVEASGGFNQVYLVSLSSKNIHTSTYSWASNFRSSADPWTLK